MITLGLDTAHKFLVIALIQDNVLIDSVQKECMKQQSEYLLPEVDKLMSAHGLQAEDIDEIVITQGPGSYTGVRIAMTFAKVLGSMMNKKVYTLSTLQLYAGKEDCYVIMDARAKRVYVGKYQDGIAQMDDTIYTNEQMASIIESGEKVIGDLHLFGQEDSYGNLAKNFVLLREQWQPVENIDILTPVYLKSNEEYL